MKILFTVVLAVLLPITASASIERENMYLVQVVNQLNAMKPLILAASKEEPPNARMQFHYQSYVDANGARHNGLLDDIKEIEEGIQARLNQQSDEPRQFQAIKGDYLDIRKIHHVN